jgi:hypothetical protein
MAFVMTRDAITPARWEIGTSHARVIADAPANGIAVLAQQDAPQWRVRVDGKKAEKRRIFGLFLGVDVPSGHHEVVFDYHARSLFAGAAMTLVTLFALPLFLFVKQRKSRKNFLPVTRILSSRIASSLQQHQNASRACTW